MFSSFMSIGRISLGLKNEFESATVNEPWVFESLKFYRNMAPCKRTDEDKSDGNVNAAFERPKVKVLGI